jgi:hypothetical protein
VNEKHNREESGSLESSAPSITTTTMKAIHRNPLNGEPFAVLTISHSINIELAALAVLELLSIGITISRESIESGLIGLLQNTGRAERLERLSRFTDKEVSHAQRVVIYNFPSFKQSQP